MSTIRSKLVTGAVVGAAALGGAAIASAASTPTTSTSPAASSSTQQAQPQRDPSKGGHTVNGKTEKLLTGDVEAKVRDSSAPYEAHIVKADGSAVEVQVNSDYTVAAVNAMGHR